MTHAPSMAAVAGFTWAWAATRGRERCWQWAALGLLAGLMGTIRWQNVLFALLPALRVDGGAVPLRRARAHGAAARHSRSQASPSPPRPSPASCRRCWSGKPSTGSYSRYRPSGPQIRWWAPRISDILWSSRNGLFATSPILTWAPSVCCSWSDRHRGLALPALAIFAAMTWTSTPRSRTGGAAPRIGMRRFDGMLPILAVGAAVAPEQLSRLVARRPQVVAGAAAAVLVLWNLTFMQAALAGVFGIGESGVVRTRRRRAGRHARTMVRPSVLVPGQRDLRAANRRAAVELRRLWTGRSLADPARPVRDGSTLAARMDRSSRMAGTRPKQAAACTFRWTSRAGQSGRAARPRRGSARAGPRDAVRRSAAPSRNRSPSWSTASRTLPCRWCRVADRRGGHAGVGVAAVA